MFKSFSRSPTQRSLSIRLHRIRSLVGFDSSFKNAEEFSTFLRISLTLSFDVSIFSIILDFTNI